MFIVNYYDSNNNEFQTATIETLEEAEKIMWDIRLSGFDAYMEQI